VDRTSQPRHGIPWAWRHSGDDKNVVAVSTVRHLKNVCSARYIENVWTLEESHERLTVLTVADEAKASGWRDLASDTTHVAT
jgi:hypothetical protein